MDNAPVLSIEEILNLIPHRFPIMLVDRVVELELSHKIIAYKNITYNEAIFQGHFPQKPVYPGVYTLEGLAQASTILAFKSLGLNSDSIVYFAGMDGVKFKRPVVPGDRLTYECTVSKMKSKLMIADVVASVEGEVAALATIKAMVGA